MRDDRVPTYPQNELEGREREIGRYGSLGSTMGPILGRVSERGAASDS